MLLGVSKSGSPTDRLMMSRPAAFNSVASAVIAMVGDGLTRARRSARNGITGLRLQTGQTLKPTRELSCCEASSGWWAFDLAAIAPCYQALICCILILLPIGGFILSGC